MNTKSKLLLSYLLAALTYLQPATAAATGCYVNIQGEKMSFKGGCNEHGPHGYGLAETPDKNYVTF